MLCIVEKLTAQSLVLNVLPWLKSLPKETAGGRFLVYYIEATPWTRCWAKPIGQWLGVEFKRLDFKLADIFAYDGDLAWLKVIYVDLFHIFLRIKRSAEFQAISRKIDAQEKRASFFLAKKAIIFHYDDSNTIKYLLYLVYLAGWKVKQGLISSLPSVLFVKKRLWMKEVKDYIRDWRVELKVIAPAREWKKRVFAFFGEVRFRSLLYLYRCYGVRALLDRRSCLDRARQTEDAFVLPSCGKAGRLMVEYNGLLNTDKPQMYSDLFFAQQSDFRRQDILVSFNYPGDPFDQAKADQLEAFGASAVTLNPKATTFSPRGIFHYDPLHDDYKPVVLNDSIRAEEGNWLKLQLENYRAQAAYWRAFFKRFQVSIYLSWYKIEARHAIISDVLNELGGVSALYQRSFESEPAAETAVNADIFFGFSNESAKIEKASGSVIPYYVITGYNGDHRFKLVEPESFEVRKQLFKNGARHIIAFFDENSIADARLHPGNQFMSVNYEFLLRQALEDRSLGLVFKPKRPKTLRQRLGSVAKLLQELESSGRCFVFENGMAHGAYPPVVAAKAADIAIHGHLYAMTAGIEAALAGIPTVLLDREGWSSCPLYSYGTEGKIIFRSWESLWPILNQHLKRPGSVPGFADWSGLLDRLDPFRDGQAAKRIGNYLSWVMNGLGTGQKRDQALSDAACRYTQIWGKDKIVSLSC